MTCIDMLENMKEVHEDYDKYMKDYDPSKESSYLMYWNINDLYGREMSQKFHVDGLEQRKDLTGFNEECKQNYDRNSDKRYILKVDYYRKETVKRPTNVTLKNAD